MKKFALALCTLTMLSACGERGGSSQTGEKPAPDAAQVQAEVEAAQNAATAAIDDADREREGTLSETDAPQRAADYKRTMLALIAGSYAGDCRTRSGDVARGAVAVDADGRVSAPGLSARSLMDADSTLTLAIKGEGGAPSEITFMGGSDKARWNVSSQRKDALTTVFSDKGNPIRCVDARPAAQGRTATLYQALASHFANAGGTLMCAEGKEQTTPIRVTFTPTGLRAGAKTFSLAGGEADEVATVDGAESTLTYRHEADGALITMVLGRTGRVDTLTVLGHRGDDLGNCSRPQR